MEGAGRQRRRGTRNPRQWSYGGLGGERGSGVGEEAGGRLIPLWTLSRRQEELGLEPLQPPAKVSHHGHRTRALLYPLATLRGLGPPRAGKRKGGGGPQPPAVQEIRLPSPQAAGQVPVVGPRHPHPACPPAVLSDSRPEPCHVQSHPSFRLVFWVSSHHGPPTALCTSLPRSALIPLGLQPFGLRPPDSLSSC